MKPAGPTPSLGGTGRGLCGHSLPQADHGPRSRSVDPQRGGGSDFRPGYVFPDTIAQRINAVGAGRALTSPAPCIVSTSSDRPDGGCRGGVGGRWQDPRSNGGVGVRGRGVRSGESGKAAQNSPNIAQLAMSPRLVEDSAAGLLRAFLSGFIRSPHGLHRVDQLGGKLPSSARMSTTISLAPGCHCGFHRISR